MTQALYAHMNNKRKMKKKTHINREDSSLSLNLRKFNTGNLFATYVLAVFTMDGPQVPTVHP
jgi:hypothetical protein